MKTTQVIARGDNYTAVSVGSWDGLGGHVLTLAPGVEIPGKVFVGTDLGSTGVEVSFGELPIGAGIDFLHTHGDNEEIYVVVRGSGQFQVDGNIFDIAEGSLVRVSPAGRRSWRNTGDAPLVVMCIQSRECSLPELGVADGHILDGTVSW